MQTQIAVPHLDEAIEFILDSLCARSKSDISQYSYDIWIRPLVESYVKRLANTNINIVPFFNSHSPIFYDAAWALCRRGILRPSTSVYKDGNSTIPACDGYSLTEYGRQWLTNRQNQEAVPADPSRFGQFFKKYQSLFGAGYHQRSQEALACYNANAYLATCTMIGSATESIFLAIAITKSGGDEHNVLSIYKSASGTRKLTDMIVGKLAGHIQQPFSELIGLITYWRNAASHGEKSNINEIEAYLSILKLMKYSQFASDNWVVLTT